MLYQTDLFGYKKKKRKGYYESILSRYDLDSLPERLERFKWLLKVFPSGYGFMMESESSFIFDEAKMAFINGQFISVILLAFSFLEHWLGGYISSLGHYDTAKAGMKRILVFVEEKHLLNGLFIKKIDRIREIRNTYIHIKPQNYVHKLSNRIFRESVTPGEIMHKDAREALILMYQISVTNFWKYKKG